MDQSRQRPSTQASQPASFGIANDMRRLKTDGTATLEELKEFLASMRGRSPQEVLGSLAKSSLIQSTILATILTAIFMAVFTVVPYYLRDPKVEAAKAEKAKAAQEKAAAAAAPKTDAASASTAKSGVANTEATEKSNVEQAAEKMQMNETKVVDPKKNPLDKDFDKLLDIKD